MYIFKRKRKKKENKDRDDQSNIPLYSDTMKGFFLGNFDYSTFWSLVAQTVCEEIYG